MTTTLAVFEGSTLEDLFDYIQYKFINERACDSIAMLGQIKDAIFKDLTTKTYAQVCVRCGKLTWFQCSSCWVHDPEFSSAGRFMCVQLEPDKLALYCCKCMPIGIELVRRNAGMSSQIHESTQDVTCKCDSHDVNSKLK